MKIKSTIALLLLTAIAGCDNKQDATVAVAPPTSQPTAIDGIGIAVILDRSGSMSESVPDTDGQARDKEGIAKRSVMAVIRRCETFANANPKRKVQLAVYQFDDTVEQIVPFSVPSVSTDEPAVDTISPNAYTAIGDAVAKAKTDLDATGLTNKHIIVVTDGENNRGMSPDDVAKAINKLPNKPSVYVIAFDVNSTVFNSVKQSGWMVLSASDGKQLQQNLDTVLGDNILLER
jgi:Mg-chelatase subunit ChlD